MIKEVNIQKEFKTIEEVRAFLKKEFAGVNVKKAHYDEYIKVSVIKIETEEE